MDANRFDTVTRLFAARRSRRAIVQGGAGLAAGALAAAGLGQPAAAQEASPVATAAGEKITYLFVQSFQNGSISPVEGVAGRYTVTLDHGLGQTIYFGDRPSRDVGTTPTPQFLDGLGFTDANPPNAAMLLETAPGETDIAVVELYNPTYDPTGPSVTYEVEVLENWADEVDLGLADAPADLATLAPQFGPAHLFIDDCADVTVQCIDHAANDGLAGVYEGVSACWNYSVCMPCEPYGHTQPDRCSTQDYWTDKCNKDHPVCSGQCGASFSYPFANC